MNSKYIPEIDGLRTIAVLAIVLFHFHVPLLDGGFIGVDVFFVISGFLITSILVRQIEAGTFSFSTFYIRRIKRLFPALFFVLAVSFIAAYLIFSPKQLEAFSGSLVYSIVSFSNVFFLMESGYFDADAYTKPLLHIWSLSVEEQFYLIWPFLLFICRRFQFSTVLVLSLISYVTCQMCLERYPSHAFFLMPFRIYEFGIGAALVWLRFNINNEHINNLLSVVGLAMITYATVNFNEHMLFPGTSALIPCIGTALLLISISSKVSRSLLGNKVSVHLGKLSYSIYLVHWPLVVFYKAFTLNSGSFLSVTEIILLLIVTYFLALFIHVLIENKFRYSSSKEPGFGLICAASAIALMLLASTAWSQKGWSWRFDSLTNKLQEQMNLPDDVYRSYAYKKIREIQNEFNKDSDKKKLLIIGDSQAGDFVNMLFENKMNDRFDIKSIVINAKCQPLLIENSLVDKFVPPKYKKACTDVRKRFVESSSRIAEADYIFIASNWRSWSLDFLSESISAIEDLSKNQVYVLSRKNQKFNGQHFLMQTSDIEQLKELAYKERDKNSWRINSKIQNIVGKRYVDLMGVICPLKNCYVLTENNDLIFFDKSHITPAGAKYLGNLLFETQDMEVIF